MEDAVMMFGGPLDGQTIVLESATPELRFPTAQIAPLSSYSKEELDEEIKMDLVVYQRSTRNPKRYDYVGVQRW